MDEVVDDLYGFARAVLLKLLARKGVTWKEHRIEDAVQDLFLAGWQVWRDQQDLGLAQNRIKSRTFTIYRDFESERDHEPKAASQSMIHLTESRSSWRCAPCSTHRASARTCSTCSAGAARR